MRGLPPGTAGQIGAALPALQLQQLQQQLGLYAGLGAGAAGGLAQHAVSAAGGHPAGVGLPGAGTNGTNLLYGYDQLLGAAGVGLTAGVTAPQLQQALAQQQLMAGLDPRLLQTQFVRGNGALDAADPSLTIKQMYLQQIHASQVGAAQAQVQAQHAAHAQAQAAQSLPGVAAAQAAAAAAAVNSPVSGAVPGSGATTVPAVVSQSGAAGAAITSMSSSVIAQAQAQLAAMKSQHQQQQQQQAGLVVASTTGAHAPPASVTKSIAAGASVNTTMAAAVQSPQMSLPLRSALTAATLPTVSGLTLQQAQAYQLAHQAGSPLTDPYLGQGIGPIHGYQNPLYRRFAPY